MYRKSILFKTICSVLLLSFTSTMCFQSTGMAQVSMVMPPPGTMIKPGNVFNPAIIRGIEINTQNPLQMKFLIESGDQPLKGITQETEYKKLVKYFLASLTVPEKNQWVNLSPYEGKRIVAEDFGQTEMGRDLLSQDYILKQLTASLMYPENELGKKFWEQVYKKASEEYGIKELPMNTFNKVWIVPEKAVIFEKDNVAWIVDSKLKVMLDKDYVALEKNKNNEAIGADQMENNELEDSSSVTTQVVREVIIPAIEKEVNTSEHFALLRQIYHSMILAAWYKRALKQSLLGKIYADKSKVKGVDLEDKNADQKIYEQYLEAFKKGVYDYIKEEYDPASQQMIPRKYFSGGFGSDFAMMRIVTSLDQLSSSERERLNVMLAYVQKGSINMANVVFGSSDSSTTTIFAPSANYDQLRKFLFDYTVLTPDEINVLLKELSTEDAAMLKEIISSQVYFLEDYAKLKEVILSKLDVKDKEKIGDQIDEYIAHAALFISQQKGPFWVSGRSYTLEEIDKNMNLLGDVMAQNLMSKKNKDDLFVRIITKNPIISTVFIIALLNTAIFYGLTGREFKRDLQYVYSLVAETTGQSFKSVRHHMLGIQDNQKVIAEYEKVAQSIEDAKQRAELEEALDLLKQNPHYEVSYQLGSTGSVMSVTVYDPKTNSTVSEIERPLNQNAAALGGMTDNINADEETPQTSETLGNDFAALAKTMGYDVTKRQIDEALEIMPRRYKLNLERILIELNREQIPEALVEKLSLRFNKIDWDIVLSACQIVVGNLHELERQSEKKEVSVGDKIFLIEDVLADLDLLVDMIAAYVSELEEGRIQQEEIPASDGLSWFTGKAKTVLSALYCMVFLKLVKKDTVSEEIKEAEASEQDLASLAEALNIEFDAAQIDNLSPQDLAMLEENAKLLQERNIIADDLLSVVTKYRSLLPVEIKNGIILARDLPFAANSILNRLFSARQKGEKISFEGFEYTFEDVDKNIELLARMIVLEMKQMNTTIPAPVYKKAFDNIVDIFSSKKVLATGGILVLMALSVGGVLLFHMRRNDIKMDYMSSSGIILDRSYYDGNDENGEVVDLYEGSSGSREYAIEENGEVQLQLRFEYRDDQTTVFVLKGSLPDWQNGPVSQDVVIQEKIDVEHAMLVLLVEDEPLQLQIKKEMLEAFGHKVLTATEGQEAFDILKAQLEQNEPIKLVVTDKDLSKSLRPGNKMNGDWLIQEIRDSNNDKISNTPIMLNTGDTLLPSKIELVEDDRTPYEQQQARAIKMGADYYLPKPFNLNDFEKQVAEVAKITDKADLTKSTEAVGGIDLDAAMLNMQIKKDGNGVPLPVEMQDIDNIKIDGLSPYIIDIKPVAPASIPVFSELLKEDAGGQA